MQRRACLNGQLPQTQEQLNSKPASCQLLQEALSRLAAQPRGQALHLRCHHHELERDYELTETVLGVGINGGVRLAHGRGRCARTFAVKSFALSNKSKQGKWMNKLVVELEIMLTVDHPHVVRLFDVYETASQLHFVMEHAEGGELFDRLVERRSFSERDAAETARQMLSVVSYLHKEGIVHRDLKPENFLYESKGGTHLKLIDFGFSRRWQSSDSPMTEQCGTLAYCAPEVQKKSCTSKIDVWSLGVTTFMLLSGYAPFEGDKTTLTTDIALGKYKWRQDHWKDVSSDGIDFVKSLLCFNIAERLTVQAALQHPWISANSQPPALPSIHLDVLRNLHRFHGASKLRRSCLVTLAHSLSHCDIGEKIRDYFLHIDAGHCGSIQVNQIMEAIAASESACNDEVQEALAALGSQGVFSYSDFLAAMVPSLAEPEESLLLDSFKQFDFYTASPSQALALQEFSQLSHGHVDDCKMIPPTPALVLAPPKLQKELRTGGGLRRWWLGLTEHLTRPTSLAGASAYQEQLLGIKTSLLNGYPIAPVLFNA